MRKYILLSLSLLLFWACKNEQKDLDNELQMIVNKAPKSVKPFETISIQAIINNAKDLRTVDFMLGDSTLRTINHNGDKHVSFDFTYQPKFSELGTTLQFSLKAKLKDGVHSQRSFSVAVENGTFTLQRDTIRLKRYFLSAKTYYINALNEGIRAGDHADNQLFSIRFQGSRADAGNYPPQSFNFLNAVLETYAPPKRPKVSEIKTPQALYDNLTQVATDASYRNLSLGWNGKYVTVHQPTSYSTNFFKFSGANKHFGYIEVLEIRLADNHYSYATVAVVAFKESYK